MAFSPDLANWWTCALTMKVPARVVIAIDYRHLARAYTIGDAVVVEGALEGALAVDPATIDDAFASTRPFEIKGDVTAFKKWMLRTGSPALLEFIAKRIAQELNASCVKAVLDVEYDEETGDVSERAVLLAIVKPEDADAMNRLLAFTESEWWLTVAHVTAYAILVDIQRE